MKKIFCIFLIFAMCLTFASCKEDAEKDKVSKANDKNDIMQTVDINNSTVKADSYDMNIKLDDVTKTLSGTATIKVTNNTSDIIKELHIRNYAASLTSSEVTDFRINDEILNYSKAEEDNSIITVTLNTDLSPKETTTINMQFNSTIPKKQNRFGYTEFEEYTTYNLSFCFPVLSMYFDGIWYDHPYSDSSSEPNVSAVSNYTVTVDAPSGYSVIATGNEETNGNITKINGKNCREFAMIISNGLSVSTNTVCNTKINYYYFDYAGNKNFNNSLCNAAVESFELYNNYFGEYIFNELDVVQTFMNSAMEYPGLVMIGLPDLGKDNLKEVDKYREDPKDEKSKVAHEVSHQWFYFAVGNDPYLEPWLDEGFAEYSEDILYAKSQMNESQIDELNDFMSDYITQIAKDKYIINKSYPNYKGDSETYSSYVYEGGKMFLYELCNIMGEEMFQNAMREYYETYKFKIANTESFINIIKKYNSSNEINTVINKYIAY
ncbi:MAG: M1 family metallopeptidase [Eubacterium sp.]